MFTNTFSRAWFSAGLMLLVSILAADRSARGQAAAPAGANADLTQAVRQLTADVQALRRDIQAMSDQTRLHGTVQGQMGADLRQMHDRVGDLEQNVQRLRQEYEDVRDMLLDQDVRHEEILEKISRPGEGGGYLLNLRGNMQEPQFRQDFNDAVHETIRSSGTLRIKNNLGYGYSVLINNNQQVHVAPYSAIDVPVPVGTVTTELLGQEGAKNWTITAPHYFQEVVINPASRAAYVEPAPMMVSPMPVAGY